MRSSRARTLTIIAAPKKGSPGDNAFIEAAKAQLDQTTSRDHVVAEAPDIVTMAKRIQEQRTMHPELAVQIVGHAISGVLELGSTWMTDEDKRKEAYQYPFFLLNSNPAALGILREQARGISELILVGCFVGATYTDGYGINGRTLSYTLCELLQCDVHAAAFEVSPTAFGKNGRYTGYTKTFTRWDWRGPNAVPLWRSASPPKGSGRPLLVTIEEILASRLPVEGSFPRLLAAPDTIRLKKIASELRFAIPEVTVQGSLDGKPARFDLLSGGKFVRRDGDYYVVVSREGTPNLTRALWGDLREGVG